MKKTERLIRVAKIAGSIMLAMGLLGCTPKMVEKQTTEITTDVISETVNDGSQELKKIGVIQLMEHTSLNIIYDAFKEELKELGYIDGENCIIDFQNAQGDISNITSIVQVFEGNKQDVVVGITTPVAQGMMSLAKTTPVIFSAVTDPISAGIVTSLDKTDKGMTGTSDAIQVDRIMDLALEITPNVKTIGYIYNPGEDNSVSNLKSLKEYVKDKDISVEESSISSSTDLQTAASTLLQKVDMIFVANDNTVAEAMPILVQEAIKAKIPVYVGADSMVMDGGFATVGIDYTELGKESARMVDAVLKGEKIEDMPVKVFKDDLYIYVNTDTAKALGIEIPESIKSNEKFVEIKK